MGAVAGLLKSCGHEVRGSDTALYPPMSEQLAALQIPVCAGYAAENLAWQPDTVIVGNVCRKDHVEVVEAQRLGLPLASFPQVLGDALLAERHSIVVSGTHGKTTTSALLSWLLVCAGRDPSFFVGGVPMNFGRGWQNGSGREFIVEGDEYDSAFFDKGSKFLHYRPQTAILSSVELDHVDIFASMEAVRDAFRKFVALIPPDGLLVVNQRSKEAMAVARGAATCRVESYAVYENGDDIVEGDPAVWQARVLEYTKSGRCRFEVTRAGEYFERFETLLVGRHNVENVVATIAVGHSLGILPGDLRVAVGSFAGVRRRQELRGVASGVFVLDDYAHHPTAVRETLRSLRKRFKGRRIFAAFEPRSATSRRRTFQDEYIEAFGHADHVIIGRSFDSSHIPEEERFEPETLALELHRNGTLATHIEDVDAIVAHLVDQVRPGDVVCIMSSGSFDGLHDKLLLALGDPVMPARRHHMAAVQRLVAQVGLDIGDLDEDAHRNFLVLMTEDGLDGCVGLEVYGEDAILRSLSVSPHRRGGGYGWLLADSAIGVARYRGVKRIYLLTETASDFFAAKHGFRVVDRTTASKLIVESTTFAHSADSTGVVAMRLDL